MQLGQMVHIPYTHRHQEQIPGQNSTRRQKNPGLVIRGIGAKKPVYHNEDIQAPPRNSQSRRIGCILVLPDAPSERPYHKRIGKKYLILQPQRRG